MDTNIFHDKLTRKCRKELKKLRVCVNLNWKIRRTFEQIHILFSFPNLPVKW